MGVSYTYKKITHREGNGGTNDNRYLKLWLKFFEGKGSQNSEYS